MFKVIKYEGKAGAANSNVPTAARCRRRFS